MFLKLQVSNGGKSLTLLWEDMHVSEMPFDWLMMNQFTPEGVMDRRNAHKLPSRTWGPEMVDDLTRIDYNQVRN